MRAICEACSQPQPVDWKAGDLCTACGQAVRPEVRCFWCVKWTPAAGKYCRGCGAAVVPGRLYGAARMLKDAGVDRFGVPRMLAELDPEQVENFTNIYNRHAAALYRHVDHVRSLERFLQRKTWSDSVEEDLIGQLPWPDERLAAFTTPADRAEAALSANPSRAESLALAAYLSENSPVSLTRALAYVVRVLLEDWSIKRDAMAVLYSQIADLRGEAALALTSWRAVYGPGIHDDRYQLQDALRQCPFQFQAAVHLAMIGRDGDDLPEGALDSPDPDLAFTAAMCKGDVQRLMTAMQDDDPLKRYAAAWRLARLGQLQGTAEVLRRAGPQHQRDLLGAITYKKQSTALLRDVLFELLENGADERVRRDAAHALALAHQPGDTLRIARAARGESQIYQTLMQTPGATPEELVEFCEYLLERGDFRADQWGMPDIAKEGRLPVDFVPRHWAQAKPEARKELCRVAEMQLEQYGDETLHRFLVNAAFGQEAQLVHEQVWSSLYRWYGRSGQGRMGPLLINAQALDRFFGSVAAFVPVLTRFLGGGTPPPFVREMSNRQDLERFLGYAEEDIIPHLEPRSTLALADALHGIMKDPGCDFLIRLSAIKLLVILAGVAEVRPHAIGILQRFRGTDLDLGSSDALARIAKY